MFHLACGQEKGREVKTRVQSVVLFVVGTQAIPKIAVVDIYEEWF